MNKYFDKNNKEIKQGDILKYDERTGRDDDYGKSIDEVVLVNGKFYGFKRIGFPRWTVLDPDEEFVPTELCFYNKNDTEIIGNIDENPELLSPETAAKFWGGDKQWYLEKCREICSKIYIARNITLNEESILAALKEIDKLMRDGNYN